MNNREHFGVLALAGLISLSAVGVALFASNDRTPSGASLAVVGDTGSGDTRGDRDQDGLPDWKELLLGTDPENKDSDGDGVLDGDEVAVGSSPNTYGTEVVAASYEAPRGLPTTDALTRELLSRYADIRKDGVVTEEETRGIIEELVSERINISSEPASYTFAALSVEEDVSVAAYENALTEALKEATAVPEYELNVFARAISENSAPELAKLAATASVYNSIRDTLLELEVPEGVASQHLALINELSAFSSAVYDLSRWGGDPLDALALINAFSATESRMSESMREVYAVTRLLKKQL